MSSMFWKATAFNQPINQWQVSNVENMGGMFFRAKAFNQPLDSWNTTNVTSMSSMFQGASSFNQKISFDTSNVIYMRDMFYNATAFNNGETGNTGSIPLKLNTDKVTNLSAMFRGASSFNQPIASWNVANVTDMDYMFDGANAFNQPINQWDVSKVEDMQRMFYRATAFNQPLDNWDVSHVKDMESMFYDTANYQQPIKFNISRLKDDPSTSWTESLEAAFINCATSSIQLDAGTNSDINAGGAFRNMDNLSYLEFNGLKNARIDGFSGDYRVKNITAGTEELKTKDERYTFTDNNHYIVTLQSPKKTPMLTVKPSTKAYDGKAITPADITAKSAKDGATDVAGTWYFVDGGNLVDTLDITTPGTHTLTLKFVPTDTATYKAAQLDTTLTIYLDAALLAHNGAGFKLHADDDTASEVIAKFSDATETKLLISGYGQIDRDKWEQLAKIIDINSYPNGNSGWSGGWIGAETFDIEFQSDSMSNQIKLPVNSKGLFNGFNRAIDFGVNNVNTANVENMAYMFYNTNDTIFGELNDWDVSNVTDMSEMFWFATAFNQPIGNWDVSNVTDMGSMFDGASSFNQPLDNWDVSHVMDMKLMFYNATNYQQPIKFNISHLKDNPSTSLTEEGLKAAFGNCATPSILLNNPENTTNIDATDAFVGTSLSYLEFSGLKNAKINGFSGNYIIEDVVAKTTTTCALNAPFTFADNLHYKVYLSQKSTLQIDQVNKAYQAGEMTSDSLNLTALMPADAGAITTSMGAITGDTGILAGGTDAPKLTGNTLSYKLSGNGAIGDTAIVPLTVSSANYHDVSFNVVIKLVELVKKQLSDCTIKPLPNQIYTGSAIKPSLKITDGNYQLIKDIDYTVVYADNTAIGTAKVTVTGKGNYEGEAVKFFSIVAAPPSQDGGDDDDDDDDDDDGDVIVIKNPTSQVTTTKPSSPPSSSTKPSQTAKAFVDVKQSDWFSQAVDYVVQKGLMNGTGNHTFSPQLTTSRAMLATMLYRLAGEPAVSGSMTFNDVASGQWYSNAVMWSQSKAIVKGYQDGSFKPNDNLTREQLVTMLYRYAKAMQYDVSAKANLSRFVDSADIAPYALGAMQWAVESGIISGTTATTLDPQGHATRAQVAMMMMRFSKAYVK